MDLKQITMTVENEELQFILYDQITLDQKVYCLLILKMIYMDMIQSIVDQEALSRAVNVYLRTQSGEKITYVKCEENLRQELIAKSIQG